MTPAHPPLPDTIAFPVSAFIALMIVVCLAWGINDLKRGSARSNWFGFGARVTRADDPFEFWIAVGSKFLGVPVGLFVLWQWREILLG